MFLSMKDFSTHILFKVIVIEICPKYPINNEWNHSILSTKSKNNLIVKNAKIIETKNPITNELN